MHTKAQGYNPNQLPFYTNPYSANSPKTRKFARNIRLAFLCIFMFAVFMFLHMVLNQNHHIHLRNDEERSAFENNNNNNKQQQQQQNHEELGADTNFQTANGLEIKNAHRVKRPSFLHNDFFNDDNNNRKPGSNNVKKDELFFHEKNPTKSAQDESFDRHNLQQLDDYNVVKVPKKGLYYEKHNQNPENDVPFVHANDNGEIPPQPNKPEELVPFENKDTTKNETHHQESKQGSNSNDSENEERQQRVVEEKNLEIYVGEDLKQFGLNNKHRSFDNNKKKIQQQILAEKQKQKEGGEGEGGEEENNHNENENENNKNQRKINVLGNDEFDQAHLKERKEAEKNKFKEVDGRRVRKVHLNQLKHHHLCSVSLPFLKSYLLFDQKLELEDKNNQDDPDQQSSLFKTILTPENNFIFQKDNHNKEQVNDGEQHNFFFNVSKFMNLLRLQKMIPKFTRRDENVRPRFAVVTLAATIASENIVGEEGEDAKRRNALSKLSFLNHLQYCKKHGYDYIVEDNSAVDERRKPQWSKIRVLQKWLPFYDWVLWVDEDTLFMNFDKRIEDVVIGADEREEFQETNNNNNKNLAVQQVGNVLKEENNSSLSLSSSNSNSQENNKNKNKQRQKGEGGAVILNPSTKILSLVEHMVSLRANREVSELEDEARKQHEQEKVDAVVEEKEKVEEELNQHQDLEEAIRHHRKERKNKQLKNDPIHEKFKNLFLEKKKQYVDQIDVVLAKDFKNINTGVVFYRNSNFTNNFLQQLWDVPTEKAENTQYHDQGAFLYLISPRMYVRSHKDAEAISSHLLIVADPKLNNFNRYPEDFIVDDKYIDDYKYRHGDWILHAASCKYFDFCLKEFEYFFEKALCDQHPREDLAEFVLERLAKAADHFDTKELLEIGNEFFSAGGNEKRMNIEEDDAKKKSFLQVPMYYYPPNSDNATLPPLSQTIY